MEALRLQFERIWSEAVTVWLAGGWAMIAIAAVALVMFSVSANLYLRLRQTGFKAVPEPVWRRWIDHPEERRGRIGALLSHVSGAGPATETAARMQEVRAAEARPFERDLRVMKACVGAAPLFGLLGTVTGMLATFNALASGSGGEETMAKIAGGISEALITTETGLVIALPGLFLQHQLARELDRYKAFLAHLETVTAQARLPRRRESSPERRAARARIAAALRRGLREPKPAETRPALARRQPLSI